MMTMMNNKLIITLFILNQYIIEYLSKHNHKLVHCLSCYAARCTAYLNFCSGCMLKGSKTACCTAWPCQLPMTIYGYIMCSSINMSCQSADKVLLLVSHCVSSSIRRRRFWQATHGCVAPYVDIILHRGRF